MLARFCSDPQTGTAVRTGDVDRKCVTVKEASDEEVDLSLRRQAGQYLYALDRLHLIEQEA